MDYNNIIVGPGGTVEPGYDPNDPNNNNDHDVDEPPVEASDFQIITDTDTDDDVDEPPVEASDFQIITDTDTDDDDDNN